MRSLSKIRKYLTEDAAKSLTHTFVSYRLDMMNAILFKIPDDLLKKTPINSKPWCKNCVEIK